VTKICDILKEKQFFSCKKGHYQAKWDWQYWLMALGKMAALSHLWWIVPWLALGQSLERGR